MIIDFDGTQADFQAKHDGMAADGDTLRFPLAGGTYSWTTYGVISKGITLLGRTTVNPVGKSANDQTTLLDDVTDRNFPVISVTASLGKTIRVSGITFLKGSAGFGANGVVNLTAGDMGAQARLDNCHFKDLNRSHQLSTFNVQGVVDHNLFEVTNLAPQSGTQSIHVVWPNWTVGGSFNTNGAGDGPWVTFPYFGTDKFLFIEDNCFVNTTDNAVGGTTDADTGSRYVFRHNHVYDTTIQTHGTENRIRGNRAIEIYSNDFHFSIFQSGLGGIRTGTGLIHDNTFDGLSQPAYWSMNDLRLFNSFGNIPTSFKGASGNNPWDINVTEADGITHIDGHADRLFFSGTAESGSNNTTINDSVNTFPTAAGGLTGYAVKRVSDGLITLIQSNTAHALTVLYFTGGSLQSPNWTAGDQYEIRRTLITIDQPGRGKGDLINYGYNDIIGTSPTSLTIGTGSKTLTVAAGLDVIVGSQMRIRTSDNANTMDGTVTAYSGTSMTVNVTSTGGSGTFNSWQLMSAISQGTGTQKWPNQVLEPIYAWNNRYNGNLVNGITPEVISDPSVTIYHAARDYYNDGDGASNSAVVAKYVAALNGVDYLGPYTYPHPLVGSTSPVSPSSIFSR